LHCCDLLATRALNLGSVAWQLARSRSRPLRSRSRSLLASTVMHGWAQAAPIHTFGGIRSVADSLKLVERAQYIWNGRRYCWYESEEDGWSIRKQIRCPQSNGLDEGMRIHRLNCLRARFGSLADILASPRHVRFTQRTFGGASRFRSSILRVARSAPLSIAVIVANPCSER
jgi:hypothetical protein